MHSDHGNYVSMYNLQVAKIIFLNRISLQFLELFSSQNCNVSNWSSNLWTYNYQYHFPVTWVSKCSPKISKEIHTGYHSDIFIG